jgi:hypothetical protein
LARLGKRQRTLEPPRRLGRLSGREVGAAEPAQGLGLDQAAELGSAGEPQEAFRRLHQGRPVTVEDGVDDRAPGGLERLQATGGPAQRA